MKKLIKIFLWSLAGALLLLIAALASLPLWLGPTVTALANKYVPQMVGTDFVMTSADLNPYTGMFRIQGVQLANPEGYTPEKALELSEMSVNLEVMSVFTDVIHVREIVLSGPYASYVTENGKSNFEQIAANMKRPAATSASQTPAPAAPEAKPSAAPGKKVVIDRLAIVKPRLKVFVLPTMPFGDIVLTDIGRASNGATLMEVGAALADAVMKAASTMGQGLNTLVTGTSSQILNVSTNLTEGAAKELEKVAAGLDQGLGSGAEGLNKAAAKGSKQLEKATRKLGDLLNLKKK
jgi:hypothetical protein